jgi:hypothetical protein
LEHPLNAIALQGYRHYNQPSQARVEDMATHGRTQLLTIPPEIRLMIYEGVRTSTGINPKKISKQQQPSMMLLGGPCLNLLSVCKQVHDEYKEYSYGQAILAVNCTSNRTISNLGARYGINEGMIRKIKKCVLAFSADKMLPMLNSTEGKNWKNSIEFREDQENMQWTPSKGILQWSHHANVPLTFRQCSVSISNGWSLAFTPTVIQIAQLKSFCLSPGCL